MTDALYLTVQGILRRWLLAAVRTCSNQLGIALELPRGTLTGGWIPLKRDRNSLNIGYLSAIALKLAPEWQLPAPELVSHLIEQLSIQSVQQIFNLHQDTDLEAQSSLTPWIALPESFDRNALDFQLAQPAPGLIRLQLSEPGIAAWLGYLLQKRPPPVCLLSIAANPSFLDPMASAPALFSIQYSHARCWALIRLAFQVGLLDFPSHQFTQIEAWHKLANFPFAWLDDRHQLQLTQPSERRLISQVFATLDNMDCCQPNSSHALVSLKVASDLSQAFQSFYQGCQIFGETQQQTPRLAQARIGLVAIVQSLLQKLLQGPLGILAPTEI